MMLATWLVEFYLSKCNELDDLVASESVSQDVDNLLAERTILEDDLRHFFETYKVCTQSFVCCMHTYSGGLTQANLEPKTIYELIQGHGHTDMYLHFATVVGDFERVVEHWVMEEEWTKAIDVINRQVSSLHFGASMLLLTSLGSPTLSSTTASHRCSCGKHRRRPSIRGFASVRWTLCVLCPLFCACSTRRATRCRPTTPCGTSIMSFSSKETHPQQFTISSSHSTPPPRPPRP